MNKYEVIFKGHIRICPLETNKRYMIFVYADSIKDAEKIATYKVRNNEIKFPVISTSNTNILGYWTIDKIIHVSTVSDNNKPYDYTFFKNYNTEINNLVKKTNEIWNYAEETNNTILKDYLKDTVKKLFENIK